MATKTRYLPGFGVLVAAESGDEKYLPGFGAVAISPSPPPLNNNRISAMHFQRHYEPIAMGA
jgi:hypothetical protein